MVVIVYIVRRDGVRKEYARLKGDFRSCEEALRFLDKVDAELFPLPISLDDLENFEKFECVKVIK